jgi:S-adenosylmethionine synthetase
MARYVAKNVVASGAASKCEVQIAYAIGVAKPVSVLVDTFGTGVVSDDVLSDAVAKLFDLRPAAIIEKLQLRRPIYNATSAYGHFGRENKEFLWEATDMADAIKAELGL